MSDETTANGKAWKDVFDKYQILSEIEKNGFADVTANQIREFREPRHLGKIDHEENLPAIFRANELGILTISNSAYRVGKFKVFARLPKWQDPSNKITEISFPSKLETLDIRNITSEQAAINTANATDMLKELTGEDLDLTVNGKMTAGIFDFQVDRVDGSKQDIQVNGARMEIDAGFEGSKAFYIFEAKNHYAENFNMRQLYYPYRAWSKKIKKPIVPIFMSLSQDVFDFFTYSFNDLQDFSSFEIVKHSRFILKHSEPREQLLIEAARATKAGKAAYNSENHLYTFPQADDFGRVLDLVGILIDAPQTVEDLATHYQFDPRQSDYYYSAARYLGLAASTRDPEDNIEKRIATPLAKEIWSKSYQEKYESIAGLLLSVHAIAEVYLASKPTGQVSIKDAIEIFENSPSSAGISGETVRRRAQTLSSWVTWLIQVTKK